MADMAIVKATYTAKAAAQKHLSDIFNTARKRGSENHPYSFGQLMGKWSSGEAYPMIDEAEKGSIFFRFVISPDPKKRIQSATYFYGRSLNTPCLG